MWLCDTGLRYGWIGFIVVGKSYGHLRIYRQISGWLHKKNQSQKGFWTCWNACDCTTCEHSLTLTHHQLSRIRRATLTQLIEQLVGWWCHLSYNLTISGVTTLPTTETDWLHKPSSGGMTSGLHLVEPLVVDGLRMWHYYPLLIGLLTKFIW
jgi:hypothetical protein